MNDCFNFTGKYSMITGAAGEIGKSIADAFARNGCNLILIDRKEKEDELGRLKECLLEKYHREISIITADIKEETSVNEINRIMKEQNMKIDFLINNAGINILSPAHMLEVSQWDCVVDTNLKGTFLMSQMAGRHMVLQGNGGVIINISSQHGEVGNVDRAPYCASKAGIINLSRALSIEWAKHGIRVNCVSPTFVIHEKNKEFLNRPAMLKKQLPLIPLGRYAVPEDVANAAVFLASPMANMITGHNLVVDGGYTAH